MRIRPQLRRWRHDVRQRISAGVARLGALQGVAGVASVAAGVLLIAGPGYALVVAGGFLLLGAWSSR